MRPRNRTLGRNAIELCGHGGRVKSRTGAREWANVLRLIGTLTACVDSVPRNPGHLTLYSRAANKVELWQRDGLKIARLEDKHVLWGRGQVPPLRRRWRREDARFY